MTRLVLVITVLALAVPAPAGASHDPSGAPFDRDLVSGEEFTDFFAGGVSGPIRFIYVFDAASGPDGQNPSGTVRQDVESLPLGPGSRHTFLTARVTCLRVTSNRATIGLELPPEIPPAVRWSLRVVEDNDGAGQDRTGSALISGPTTVCPADPAIPLAPIFGGDLTVHDARPLPTSKGQCKHGGWRAYSNFKNQGACVKWAVLGSNQ